MATLATKNNSDKMQISSDDGSLSEEEYDDLDGSAEDSSMSEMGDSFEAEYVAELNSMPNGKENEEKKDVIYGNFGWADAMSKVLKTSKPKAKKSVILSKAKKDVDVIKKTEVVDERLTFEVEGSKTEASIKGDPDAEKKNSHAEKMLRRKRRKEWDLVARIIPSITEDRERERTLSKIATRGVVQLFNSVKIQQKTIQDKLREAGPLERKREKALKSIDKSDFLELLKGGKKGKTNIKKETVEIKQEDSTWSVLRDDFMPQVSMRDWDKQESSDSEND